MPIEASSEVTERPKKRKSSHLSSSNDKSRSTHRPKSPSKSERDRLMPDLGEASREAVKAQSRLLVDDGRPTNDSSGPTRPDSHVIKEKDAKRDRKRKKRSKSADVSQSRSDGEESAGRRKEELIGQGSPKYAAHKDPAIEALRKRMRSVDGSRSHESPLSPLGNAHSVRSTADSLKILTKRELKKEMKREKDVSNLVPSSEGTRLTESVNAQDIPRDRLSPTQTKAPDSSTYHRQRIEQLEKELRKQKRLVESQREAVEAGGLALHTTKKALEDAQKALKESEEKALAKHTELGTVTERLEERESTIKEREQKIETLESAHEQIKGALDCQVCFDPLNDPHILSCGHVACKDCLKSWFRTTTAYRTEVPYPITPTSDLSFRTKLCHVCRAVIIRRPARIYLMQSLLEPLSIVSVPQTPLPTLSQDPDGDPWNLTFPPEKETYKLQDDADNVERCPGCYGEIDEGFCYTCAKEFSDYGMDEDGGSSIYGLGMDGDGEGDGGDFGYGSEDASEEDRVHRQALFGGRGGRNRNRSPPPNLPFDHAEDDHDGFDAILYNYEARNRARRDRRRARAGRGGGLVDVEAVDDDDHDDEGDVTGLSDDDSEEEDSEDEYGGSFIDDDDIAEVVSDTSGGDGAEIISEDESGLPHEHASRESESDSNSDSDSDSNSDSDSAVNSIRSAFHSVAPIPSEDDEPSIDQLRQRRARRFGGAAAAGNQSPISITEVLDSDDEVLEVPRPAARALSRRSRSRRHIVSDDESD